MAGVSPRTVSNVVNDYRWVSDRTRQAVLDAIDEVGYVPNLSARGLRQGRMGAISLAIPELRNPWFTEVADAVMAAASKHGLAVVLEQTAPDGEREYLLGPRTTRVDGVLFAAQTLRDEDAVLLRDARRPVVLLGEYVHDSPVDQVTVADREGARMATEHLLMRGRRRVLVIGSHPTEERGTPARRLQGVRDAYDSAGLPWDEQLVIPRAEWTRAAGGTVVSSALSKRIEFDAIFCFNDALALGALRALNEAGVRVPEDVAVIGFDDVEDAMYSQPPLTTVAPDMREYGDTAVSWLVERMSAAGRSIEPRTARVDSRLAVRSST